MRKETKYVIALILLGLAFVGVVAWTIYESIPQIYNYGTIRVIGVEVYADADLTQILDRIEWGVLDPGENKSYSAWIKNIGNDAQKLVTWTEAWSPVNASDWISLSWDYVGSWVAANASVPVVLTLHVDANIEGVTNFSFDIWVKGVH
jgi:hypothetical protein